MKQELVDDIMANMIAINDGSKVVKHLLTDLLI